MARFRMEIRPRYRFQSGSQWRVARLSNWECPNTENPYGSKACGWLRQYRYKLHGDRHLTPWYPGQAVMIPTRFSAFAIDANADRVFVLARLQAIRHKGDDSSPP